MSSLVIAFHYTLTDKTGKVQDSSSGAEPLSFLSGVGQIIPGLEKELILLKKGDKAVISVAYAEAYGDYDQSLLFEVEKSKFPTQEVKVGDVFQVEKGSEGQMVTVVDIKDNHIMLDGNHPLAGKDLVFSVEMMDIRPATQEEISHGHTHGAGGHHH